MSEYQYYEFHAMDRPLGQREQHELRAISTRTRITASSFTNHYKWGDLNAAGYDSAAALLVDLGGIAAPNSREEEFADRLAALFNRHARKGKFIERLRAAGLG